MCDSTLIAGEDGFLAIWPGSTNTLNKIKALEIKPSSDSDVVDDPVHHNSGGTMGYFIRALQWKKSNPRWKVQFISYKKKDIRSSTSKKPKKEWDVEKTRWRGLGFHSLMTVDEARVRAKHGSG